ncbi:DUF4179 domain-containing protein [Bacillus sp. JJ1566]|uniref:DUF4179 domain-containing protein n=1 Tax=Bacillus sp. JJ1566 TaxID=3122961 RepID=UPI003000F7BA
MEKWEEQIKMRVNPQVPASVEQSINETLHSLPKKKTFPRLFYPVAAVFLVGFLLFGVSFMSPTLAETLRSVPVIGSIFKMVGDVGTQKGEKEGLTTLLGQQVEINGQVITFTESLFDGSQIHIGYIVESYATGETLSATDLLSPFMLTVDGKGVSYGMGERGETLENGDYAGIISISIQEELPEEFILGIRSQKEKALNLELQISKQGENKSFLVNQTVENADLMMHYDKVTFFPTSTEIAFRQVMDEKTFENRKYEWMNYQVIDDQGRVLQPLSGGGGGGMSKGKFVETLTYYFEPLEKLPKSLTFKPYLMDIDEDRVVEEVKGKWKEEVLTLSQGEIGETSILDIKIENGLVTLTVETIGDDAYWQANSIWIEDQTGNAYYSEKGPIRVGNSVNQYEIQFEANITAENIQIVTYKQKAPIYLEELEVTIELGE